VIAAVHDPGSLGVHTYVDRLSRALRDLSVDYRPASRASAEVCCHFHLANSTRMIVPDMARHRGRYLLTIHDVIPRSRALRPIQRAVILPLCLRRASRVVVHSRHAADMLVRTAATTTTRLEIVPHPAPSLGHDVGAARAALGLALDGPPVFVLPGTLRAAKLVTETLDACAPLVARGRLRLLLSGRLHDEAIGRAASAAGAILLRNPDRVTYEHAIVAADAVLCMRADTVGESNGPLLDAVGAGKPSLITAVGSAPEIAEDSAQVVAPSVAGIRAGIEALLDEGERARRAGTARVLGPELSWEASAEAHAELLDEVASA
jgi:glycosyltransferase involved in cell wall biosynthesis